jgi:mitotic spindle assembly checkpoint protein MAD2
MSRLVLHSILYQRGIYPDDSFKQTKYHELSVHVTKEPQLKGYLDTVMKQMQGWSCLLAALARCTQHAHTVCDSASTTAESKGRTAA